MPHLLSITARPLSLLLLAALTSCASTPTTAHHSSSADSATSKSSTSKSTSNRPLFAGPPLPPPTDTRPANGAPGPAYWQQRVDYTINATLDAPAKRLTATEQLLYTNNSPQPLSAIWLNLEQNLFRRDSDGARLSAPNDRFGNRDQFQGGFENLTVTLNGAQLPVDVNQTIGRVDLPAPIPARGGTLQLNISWSFDIPNYGSDRMGIDTVADGDIFQIAQWFPSACVFDDVYGWNTLPYLGQGEFYTNYGTYDVRLTVPADHIVAATGELQNPDEVLSPLERERLSSAHSTHDTTPIRNADEIEAADKGKPTTSTKTWHFLAEDVRTFAWASSRAFLWDACFVPGSGKGSNGDPSRGQGTLCQSFYPKEAAGLWSKDGKGGGGTQDLRRSIEHYGKKWYAYPYPTASNINGIVGGMEYPMIIFCSGRDAADGEKGLWGVTTHEIGHNWFPMLINTDERRHAWMDEGFNTFINYYATLERYPGDEPRRGNPRRWAKDNAEPAPQPIDIPADQVEDGQLGALEYAKAAAGMTTLREGILGPDRFDHAFREYLRRWAFKSPRPWDFFRTMEDASGEDLGYFFRGWFYETGTLDQSIKTVMQPGGAEGSGDSHNARVTFENKSQLVMPVLYRVTYDDTTTEDRRLPAAAWFNTNQYQTQWDTRTPTGKVRKIKKVEIDPDGDLPDVELKNNVWP